MGDTSAVPNPGSVEAVRAGCICPRIDNHWGKGIDTHNGRQFIMSEGCPLHWPAPHRSIDRSGR